MKYKELQSMSENELQDKLKELKMDLIKANAQVATGTIPKNPGQVKQTKKTVAKIKSLLKKTEPRKEAKQDNPKAEENKIKTEEKKE
jgi:large subunit ribosomal protein L29